MVSCGDANTGPEVQGDGKDEGRTLQWCIVGPVASHQRNDDKKRGLEPIDMLVPIGERHRLLGDVRLGYLGYLGFLGFLHDRHRWWQVGDDWEGGCVKESWAAPEHD